MKRISDLMRPDMQTIESMHGDMYHTIDRGEGRVDTSYNTVRDKAEQAIVRKCAEDAEFAAFCANMTFAEWEAYLDKHCGMRPGRGKWYNRYNKTRGPHGGSRTVDMPEGMITLEEAGKTLGVSDRAVYHYYRTGVRHKGEHVYLTCEKHGKNNYTRPEWVSEFQQAAWWLKKGLDKPAVL